MIQQSPVHKRLTENAMKFDNLLRELGGMKFMNMKTKQFYEISGYQNSLRTTIELELYNHQAVSSDSEFLYVVLGDSTVETALAAVFEQGLVPVVTVPAQEETEDGESEEDCDCLMCTTYSRPQGETDDIMRDMVEMFSRMGRGQ